MSYKCPKCNAPMLLRENSHTGERFWGCSRFPDCRGSRGFDGMTYAEKRQYLGVDDYDDMDDFHPGNPRFYGDN